LDAISYYLKYKNFKFQGKNTTLLLEKYNIREEQYTNAYKFSKKQNVNIIDIEKPLNNDYLQNISKKVEIVDFVMLDFNLYIRGLSFIRNNYNFQAILSRLIIVLNKLNKEGNMLLHIWNITNKMVMDVILYISSFFNKVKLDNTITTTYYPEFSSIIFKGFKGKENINFDKLYEINKQNYIYDPTGGYNYEVVNENERKMFNITHKSKNSPKKYINNMITLKNPPKEFYNRYKSIMKNIYNKKIQILFEIRNLHLNLHNENYMKEINERGLLKAINYAKSIGLDVVDWINEGKMEKVFHKRMLGDLYNNLEAKKYRLREINTTDKITTNNKVEKLRRD